MLFLLLFHHWSQFLAHLLENLFQCFYAILTSSFSRKVLIEQAELVPLQLRQICEHLPKLQAMARLLHIIRYIMANKILIAKERLNSISDMQIRFEK